MIRLVTTISIVLTVLLLAFSLWRGFRPSRLRPVLDVLRVVVQAAAAVAVPALTGVTTEPIFVLVPAAVGLLAGVLQGQQLRVSVDEGRIFATRSWVGFLIWSLGLVTMQGAGLANRVGVLQIGQAVTWLSIGITVGLILGRQRGVGRALQSSVAGAAPLLLVVVGLLAACVDAAEIDVVLDDQGAGSFEIALGVALENVGDDGCEDDDTTPGAYVYEETHSGFLWCVIGFGFNDIDGLRALLLSFNESGENFRVNCLAIVGGKALVDLQIVAAAEDLDAGFVVPIRVTVPGPIESTNGAVNGNTISWNTSGFVVEGGQATLNIQVNAGLDGECPTSPVSLVINAFEDGRGTAILSVPVLPSGQEDTQRVADDIAATGWQVNGFSPESATISASTSWTVDEGIGSRLERLPFLDGSVFSLEPDPRFDELTFDAFVDLSGYDVYWTGINADNATPPISINYTPPGAIVTATGDWTDPAGLTFSWAAAGDGLLHALTATTTTDAAAVEAANDDAVEQAQDAQSESGDGDTGESAASSGDDGPDTANDPNPGAEQGEEGGVAASDADAARDGEAPRDSEDVSAEEALNTAIAGLLAAAAAGVITLRDAADAIEQLTEAADRNAAERGEARAEAERAEEAARRAEEEAAAAERDRLLDLYEVADRVLMDDAGAKFPVIPLWDELEELRDRIQDGTASSEDAERLEALTDFILLANQGHNEAAAQALAQEVSLLTSADRMARAALVGSKLAAGLLGTPAAAAAVTTIVDTVAARNLGLERAALVGLTNGAVDLAAGRLMDMLRVLPTGSRVPMSSMTGGVTAMGQNIAEQLIANGGDVDAINWEQAENAGYLGLGLGAIGGANPAATPDTPTVTGTKPTTFGSDDLGHGWGQRTTPVEGGTQPTTFGSDDVGHGWGSRTPGTQPASPDGPPVSVDGPTPSTTPAVSRDIPVSDPPTSAPEAAAPTAAGDDILAAQQRAASPTDSLPASGPPTAGPSSAETLSRWETFGANGQGQIYDHNGHLMATIDANGQIRTPTGEPIAAIETGLTTKPTGWVTPDGRRIHFREDGTPMEVVDGMFRPATDISPPQSTMRPDLATNVRLQWDLAGAGPNGELFGPNGQQIGTIDATGRMTTLGGDEITGYSEAIGGRLPQVRTADGSVHGEIPEVIRSTPPPTGPSETNVADLLNRPPQSRPPTPAPDTTVRGSQGAETSISGGPAGETTMRGAAAGETSLRSSQAAETSVSGGQAGETTLRGPEGAETPAGDTTMSSSPRSEVGATPPDTTMRAPSAGAVSIDSDGLASSPSGEPVLRVDDAGGFVDLDGNTVSSVRTRDGRIVGYTDASGQRWVLTDD